jgi:hypothetical protein
MAPEVGLLRRPSQPPLFGLERKELAILREQTRNGTIPITATASTLPPLPQRSQNTDAAASPRRDEGRAQDVGEITRTGRSRTGPRTGLLRHSKEHPEQTTARDNGRGNRPRKPNLFNAAWALLIRAERHHRRGVEHARDPEHSLQPLVSRAHCRAKAYGQPTQKSSDISRLGGMDTNIQTHKDERTDACRSRSVVILHALALGQSGASH